MNFHLALLLASAFILTGCASQALKDQTRNTSETVSETNEEAVPVPENQVPADAVIVNEEDQAGTPQSAPVKEAPKPLPKDKAEIKNRITEVELESLGDPKKKTLGLYGELKACQTKLNSKAYGGSGHLFWDEPGDKLSEKWLDHKNAEKDEFQATLMIVRYRRDYLKNQLAECEKALQTAKHNPSMESTVSITEGDSDNDERVHSYMCRFVAKGASMRDFLIQTFSRGILQLENFDLSQKFLVASLKDQKGASKPHGLMFMGWKLSFDRGPLSLREIIFDEKDAKLMAWTFADKSKVTGADKCLRRDPGVWNP